jgi:heme exporter protein D
MWEAGSVLVVVHLVSTLFMVGMIWTVQLVHYPLMALVGSEHFTAYEAAHAPRMAAVVMIPWTLQGITVAGLLLDVPDGVDPALVWAAAVAALVPVAVTVLASVPAHQRLGAGFDASTHRTLVRSNWIRTVGWTVHGVIAVAIAVTAG